MTARLNPAPSSVGWSFVLLLVALVVPALAALSCSKSSQGSKESQASKESQESDWDLTADEKRTECPVHHQPLLVGTAWLRFGMFDRKKHFPEAGEQFPLANSSVRAGCTIENVAAKVKYCAKCRAAEAAREAKYHADVKAGRIDASAP